MSAASEPGHASHCVIYTDGGARGNPGPAAAGAVILADDGRVIVEISEYLGVATNNVAEYRALLLALQPPSTKAAVRQTSAWTAS